MVQAMREFGGEELKDIELSGTGTQVGVRETRRVKGPYVLTEQDALRADGVDLTRGGEGQENLINRG